MFEKLKLMKMNVPNAKLTLKNLAANNILKVNNKDTGEMSDMSNIKNESFRYGCFVITNFSISFIHLRSLGEWPSG